MTVALWESVKWYTAHKERLQNSIHHIVYSGSKDIVKMTMVNGRILYENGEFKGVDAEKIYYNAQKATDRLK